jgi:hypothetical protein
MYLKDVDRANINGEYHANSHIFKLYEYFLLRLYVVDCTPHVIRPTDALWGYSQVTLLVYPSW